MNSLCIIDDDPILIFGLRKMLSFLPAAAKVESFESSVEAFDLLKPMLESNHIDLPDVIFLDINMPMMDGWQFLEAYSKVKKNHPSKEIDIYLVSSSIDLNDHKRASEINEVKGFLVKPLSLDDLKKYLN